MLINIINKTKGLFNPLLNIYTVFYYEIKFNTQRMVVIFGRWLKTNIFLLHDNF